MSFVSLTGRAGERKRCDPVAITEALPRAWVSRSLRTRFSDDGRTMFPEKQKERIAPHRGSVTTEPIKRKSGRKFYVYWQKR